MSNITRIIYTSDNFKKLITSFLNRGKLKDKYIDTLTSPENMKLFGQAFTAASADPEKNYEIFEQLGDLSANKFIVSYAYKRFPQLKCPKGVKVAARLRINYGSKDSFSEIADKLGFWNYISAAEDGSDKKAKYRGRHKDDLLEDVLEAIIGCTEQILDEEYMPGVGYAIVYDILVSIFDDINISLNYVDLYDAITRMKETFDMFGDQIGKFKFIDSRNEHGAVTTLYQIPVNAANKKPRKTFYQGENVYRPNLGWLKIGSGAGIKKKSAQQIAAEEGILEITRLYDKTKQIPNEYLQFCK